MDVSARLIFLALAALAAAPSATIFGAQAQTIGAAELVEKNVTRQLAGKKGPLAQGDSVARAMVVETAGGSSARLRFVDKTTLTLGPQSRVTLDRFVFAGDDKARRMTVNLVRGGFRFISGQSDKTAYEIRTPHATIGVRGTTIGFIVTPQSTTIILKEGGAGACLRATRGCVNLTRADETVVLTARRASRPAVRRPGDPDFADWCRDGGAACGL